MSFTNTERNQNSEKIVDSAKIIDIANYNHKNDWKQFNIIDFGEYKLIIGDKFPIKVKELSVPLEITAKSRDSYEIYKSIMDKLNYIELSTFDNFIKSKYEKIKKNCYFRLWKNGLIEVIIGEYQFKYQDFPTLQEIEDNDPYNVNKLFDWIESFRKENNIGVYEFLDLCGLKNFINLCDDMNHLKYYISSKEGYPTDIYKKFMDFFNQHESNKEPLVRMNYTNFEKMKICIRENLERYRVEEKIHRYGFGFNVYEKDEKIICHVSLQYGSRTTESDIRSFFIDNGCIAPDIIELTHCALL